MSAADAILFIFAGYAVIGLVFGVAFITIGVPTVDHAASGATWSFRVLILPGAAVLWPLMLIRWVRAVRSPPEQTP